MALPGENERVSWKLPSTQPQGGADDLKVFCQPCDRADERLPVFGYCVDCEEYLCQLCYKTHTRPRPVQYHRLLDNEHMPLAQSLQKSPESTQCRKDCALMEPCLQHVEEVIEFFCHDHSALICSVCVAEVHTSTFCHTDYIPDISEQTLDSTEFKKTLKDLDKVTDKCCRIIKDLKLRISKSSSSLTDVIEEMENFREWLNKSLDELKQEINNTLKIVQHNNNKLLKTTETTCDAIIKSLQTSADTLKDYNTNRKADQLFAELKIAQQLILDNVKTMSHPSAAKDVDEYTFEPNQAIKELFQKEKTLGTFNSKKPTKQAQSMNQAATSMKMSTPTFINVRTKSDEKDCKINGIAVSPQNQVFVADHNNKSVKMIDTESGTIEQVELESEPWDIITVTKDMLAVTLPFSETIQFISFSSNSLSIKNKLKVDGMCFGISQHQEKLAVTFPIESKLLIMDLKGTIQKKVMKDSNSDDIFCHPEYVTTNSQSVYVSDRDKGVVIRLNWQGEMTGQYDRIKWPSGITSLDDGSFLVNDNSSNCIIQSHGECEDCEIVLEDIYQPHALSWYPETSTLCISRDNPFKVEGDNHIVLYKRM